MKKRLIIIVLAISVIIAGCGKKNKDSEIVTPDKETVEEGSSTEEKAEEKNDTDEDNTDKGIEDIIGLQYDKSGDLEIVYSEEYKDSFSYNYKIPEILDESADAQKINKDIFDFAKSSINTVEDIIEGTDDAYVPDFFSIDFQAFENGDIISLLIKGDGFYSDWREYQVFNYNKAEHRAVKNEELLKTAGISEEQFLNNVRGTLGNVTLSNLEGFLTSTAEMGELDAESEEEEQWRFQMVPEYFRYYTDTISEDTVNKDMMTYIDGDGDLCVIAIVYVPAGAGMYYFESKVEDVDPDEVVSKYMKYAEKYHYDGFERDCLMMYEDEGYIGYINHEVASGNSYEEEFYFGFDSDDLSKVVMQFYGDGYEMLYRGNLRVTGMDENGIKFEYVLNECNGEKFVRDDEIVGEYYINTFSNYDDETEDFSEGISFKHVDGVDMLDTNGKTVEFDKTFG